MRLPAIYGSTDYARSGGLMEFVPDESEAFGAAVLLRADAVIE
jgi:hypothetical protein